MTMTSSKEEQFQLLWFMPNSRPDFLYWLRMQLRSAFHYFHDLQQSDNAEAGHMDAGHCIPLAHMPSPRVSELQSSQQMI